MPLVPVYLSVTTGLAVSELSGNRRDRVSTVTRGAGLFILGFSAVFIGLGLSATEVGAVLLGHRVPITRLAGVLVIAMALFMLAGPASVDSASPASGASIRAGCRGTRSRFRSDRGGVRLRLDTLHRPGLGFDPGDRRRAWRGAPRGSTVGDVLRRARRTAARHRLAFHRASSDGMGSTALGRLSASMAVVLLGYGLLLAFDRLSWLTPHAPGAPDRLGRRALTDHRP
jgi:cytochrome c biogenesis protein CcdA